MTEVIVTHGVCRWYSSRNKPRFTIRLLLVVTLVACHSSLFMPAQLLTPRFQNPLDRIAVQVMTAQQPPYCANVHLSTGPTGLVYGCVATSGDTTLYFYQDDHADWMGPLLIAGRTWIASAGTAVATDSTLRMRLNQIYGPSRDCIRPEHREHSRYYQWRTPSFMVFLEEGRAQSATGPWSGQVEFLQYNKAPVLCTSWDAMYPGTRPLVERENNSP
jgi:hypothetical protein